MAIRRPLYFDGFLAGSVATAELPMGRKFHGVALEIATLADIEDIVVKVNGNEVKRYTAAFLDTMNKYKGRTAAGATSSIVYVPFGDYGNADPAVDEFYSLNTLAPDVNGDVITSVRLEVSIAAGATSTGLTGTTYSDFVDRADVASRPHMLLHTRRTTYSGFSGAGEHRLQNITFGTEQTAFLRRLFLTPSANDISSFKINVSGQVEDELTKALNERNQLDGDGRIKRVPQAGTIVYDRNERGRAANDLPLVGASSFEVEFVATGAMTLTVHTEMVGGLQG